MTKLRVALYDKTKKTVDSKAQWMKWSFVFVALESVLLVGILIVAVIAL